MKLINDKLIGKYDRRRRAENCRDKVNFQTYIYSGFDATLVHRPRKHLKSGGWGGGGGGGGAAKKGPLGFF